MVVHRFARVAAAVVAVALCAVSVAGCSDFSAEEPEAPPATTPQPRLGGHLVYGIETDPNGLDPTKNAWDPSGIQLANALYDPLGAFNERGEVRPYLAESFKSNPEYTKWTVTLRQGVTFSNGTPLDAEAVLYWLEAIRKSLITGPAANILADGARAIDNLTVEIPTKRPWATLPALVSGQGGYVIARAQLDDPAGHSNPVGTGPFRLKNWQIDKKFELVKNQTYWRAGRPYLDAVDFLVVRDARQRIDMLSIGEIDVTSMSAPWENARLAQVAASRPPSSPLKVERDPGDAEKTALAFNTTKPPLNDVRVRQAVAYATDLRAIAARNDWPVDRLAQGPFDPASPYFSAAAYPGYDLEKAKALVKEYLSDTKVRNRPREITFKVMTASDGAEFTNQLVTQWAQAGIKVSVDYVELKDTVRQAVLGLYDVAMLRYFASADPDVLWHFFVNDTIVPNGISLNFTRFYNDDITNAMNEGRATTDVETRKRAYRKVQATMAEQLPYIWLLRYEWRVATTARVHDAKNVTLPDGERAMPFVAGTHTLAETWVDR